MTGYIYTFIIYKWQRNLTNIRQEYQETKSLFMVHEWKLVGQLVSEQQFIQIQFFFFHLRPPVEFFSSTRQGFVSYGQIKRLNGHKSSFSTCSHIKCLFGESTTATVADVKKDEKRLSDTGRMNCIQTKQRHVCVVQGVQKITLGILVFPWCAIFLSPPPSGSCF